MFRWYILLLCTHWNNHKLRWFASTETNYWSIRRCYQKTCNNRRTVLASSLTRPLTLWLISLADSVLFRFARGPQSQRQNGSHHQWVAPLTQIYIKLARPDWPVLRFLYIRLTIEYGIPIVHLAGSFMEGVCAYRFSYTHYTRQAKSADSTCQVDRSSQSQSKLIPVGSRNQTLM